jgi:hypothetical protein
MASWWMLSWELVARQRWLVGLSAAYFALACLVCPLLPEDWRCRALGSALSVLMGGLVPFVVGGLSYGWEGRLEDRASAFPDRLFTLPVPTVVLAGPGLVLGTVVSVLGWLLCAACVLRPCGIEAPLAWPAALGAAMLVWCQALAWTPFPWPYSRLVIASVALLAVGLSGPLLAAAEVNETVVASGLAVLVPLGYAAALLGVERARHGAGRWEPAPGDNLPVTAAAPGLPPFSSPLRAQLWLEWRSSVWSYAFLSGFFLVWAVPLTHFVCLALNSNEPIATIPWVLRLNEQIGPGWAGAACVLLGPLALALLGDTDLGRWSSSRNMRLSAYLATLPVTPVDVIRPKLLFAAGVSVLSWSLAVVLALTWATLAGQAGDMERRLVAVIGSPAAALAVLAGALVLAMLVSWLWLVRSLWVGLGGFKALLWVPVTSTYLIGFAIWFAVDQWLSRTEAISWLMDVLLLGLLLKGLATAWVVRRLRRDRLLSARVLAGLFIGWAALAVLVGVLASELTGVDPLLPGVLLLMPLALPLAAPLALARNRHR